jgi:hypothetical protein
MNKKHFNQNHTIMKKQILLMVVLFLNLLTIKAQWAQLGSSISGDNSGDKFGNSVSLSDDGMTFASGSYGFDANGINAGLVRVFHYTSNGWTQVGNDISGQQEEEGFGFAVSLSADGTVVAAGAPNNLGSGGVTGCVRIYKNIDGTWTQVGQTIEAEAPEDMMGYNVSLNNDGTIVACAAPFNDGDLTDMGHVRIYHLENNNWVQMGSDIDGEDAFNYSGFAVSLNASGNIVAIGAPENTDSGNEAGHVRVYQYQNEEWVQMGGDIDAESEEDYLGYSVSLNDEGNILAASAIFDALNGPNSGSIYVYHWVDGSWQQLGNTIVGEHDHDNFGISIGLNGVGNMVVGGAPTNSDQASWAGSSRVFKLEGETWNQVGEDIDGENEDDQSGTGVSINKDGSVVATGSIEHNMGAGQVRVFQNAIVGMKEKKTVEDQNLVYPNPTTGRFNIDLKDYQTPEVYLYDMTGKVLFHQSVQVSKSLLTLDLSQYQSGVYLIRIYDQDKTFSGKVVKR